MGVFAAPNRTIVNYLVLKLLLDVWINEIIQFLRAELFHQLLPVKLQNLVFIARAYIV